MNVGCAKSSSSAATGPIFCAMDVVVPSGCAGGSTVTFTDATGRELSAMVPEGLTEGDIFHVAINDFLDDILDGLTQDRFATLCDGFIDKNCDKFLIGGAGEYSLAQTEVHQNYVRLYESRIESYLKRHSVSSDEFMAALLAADAAEACGPATRKTLSASLLLVQDFGAFAKLCQQRALEQAG